MDKIIISFIDENGNSILFHNQEVSRNWIEVNSAEEANTLIKNMFEKSNAIFANIFIMNEEKEIKNKFQIFKYRENNVREESIKCT